MRDAMLASSCLLSCSLLPTSCSLLPVCCFLFPVRYFLFAASTCILDTRVRLKAGRQPRRNGRQDVPRAAEGKIINQRPARRGSTLAAGQVLSMFVNGRLTTPPQAEAVVVTNSVATERQEGVQERRQAKAVSLEIFVHSADSRSRHGRTGGRARRAVLRNARQTAAPPACASHRLSPAREAARS